MQKGQIQIILIGILVIAVLVGGAYYLGRQTLPKPQPASVVSRSPQPTVVPTPTSTLGPELTFPSPCISPAENPICITSASRIRTYNILNDLIRGSEIIVVGQVLDSCLDRNSASKSTNSSQTPYIGHLVIERSLKNTFKLEKIFIETAYLDEIFNVGGVNGQTYRCDYISLEPNKSYLLFLKKHPSGKFYRNTDLPFEIQNSILMRHSRSPSDFEEEIIQLGFDGLSERVSKLSQ